MALNPTPMPTAQLFCGYPGNGRIYFKIGPEEGSLDYRQFARVVQEIDPPPNWLVWELAKVVAGGGAAVDLLTPTTIPPFVNKAGTGTTITVTTA